MLIACLIFAFFYSARDDYDIDKEAYHSLTIKSDGNISRFFPTIYKASCNLDVTNFPFDDQVTFFKGIRVKLFRAMKVSLLCKQLKPRIGTGGRGKIKKIIEKIAFNYS